MHWKNMVFILALTLCSFNSNCQDIPANFNYVHIEDVNKYYETITKGQFQLKLSTNQISFQSDSLDWIENIVDVEVERTNEFKKTYVWAETAYYVFWQRTVAGKTRPVSLIVEYPYIGNVYSRKYFMRNINMRPATAN